MTFSSITFLFIFLPVVFLLYLVCANMTLRNILLVLASLAFYAFGEPLAVFIMIASIVINYCLGILCTDDRYKKIALIGAVILNIGLLIVFKYLGFLVESFDSITKLGIPVPMIALPIGISFFTFQGLSYVIDVYRDKNMVQKNLLYVFLYISFFPQLIAGPIVKYHDIEEQLSNRVVNINRITNGIFKFIIGLSKKVIIANQMGYMADLIFNANPTEISTGVAWLGALCYTFQIFFDFSGYSDMAIGLGCMFGFDFKRNFNYPLISCSIQDFWRRWHISLSTWFKEYVYIPLGGNRCGTVRTYVNKFIVFFLTGLWHGANLTFIIWGLAHGTLIVIEGVVRDRINSKSNPIVKIVGFLYTFLFVLLAFVMFRADSISHGFVLLSNMFRANIGNSGLNALILGNVNGLFITSLVFAIIFSAPVAKVVGNVVKKSKYKVVIFEPILYIGTLIMFMTCIIMLVSSGYNPFIYFRF